MTDQRRQFHWDKRHKKYVQLGAHETVKGGKRVRTESGKVSEGGKRVRTESGKVSEAGQGGQARPD